ncbi:MAG: F0F1 ATP synthase subunit B' [Magnetovibrio sp.]|nr:F0F1 ATP synthase subunit B' [Magnetovibrio sp.]
MRILNSTIAISLAAVLGVNSAQAAGLPQLDPSTFSSQLIWLAITFITLYVLMAKVALPKIGDVLEERQRKIDDNLAKAEELKSQADAASVAYEKSLSEARAKAHDAIREVKDEALAEAHKRQSAQNAQLQAKISESEQAISKARDEALAGIKDVATDVATSAVEKLIGEAPKDGSVASAIEAALKDRA